MGKRGPKRTPTANLRIAGSTLVGDRCDDLAVPETVPVRPAWLSERAGLVFDCLVEKMEQTPGLLTGIDADALAVAADAYAEFVDHTATLAAEGWTVATAEGGVKPNPIAGIRQNAYTRWAKGCAQFGLDPADRAGLRIEAPKGNTGKLVGLGGA